MNPINDEMPTKDGNPTDAQKEIDSEKTTELFNNTNEISEEIKTIEKITSTDNTTSTEQNENEAKIKEVEKTQIEEHVNMPDDEKKIDDHDEKKIVDEIKTKPDDGNTNKLDENDSKLNLDEVNKDQNRHPEPVVEQQTESLLKNDDETKTVDGATNILKENENNKTNSVMVANDEEEEIEEYEDVEDVEIPGDGDVDEIIVPDEAEAEDLTDDKDDNILDKSLNEDEEEDITKDSETEDNDLDTSPHEEETTKSSEAVEKDENELSTAEEESDKKSLNNDQQDDTCSKDYEEERDIENVPIEPELVAIEEGIKNTEETNTNDEQLNEDTSSQTTLYDPLNYTVNLEQDDEDTDIVKAVENENSLENNAEVDKAANDDDDDEVQFIETRNSPICIESDDDDANSKDTTETSYSSNIIRTDNNKQTISTPTATVTVPKNIIVTRTSARKSTAKPPQPPQQSPGNNSPLSQARNKPKNFSYLQKATNYKRSSAAPSTQHIVDCIELLDSSDEESASSRKPQPKTPQKRTLLAAKGNYYKTNSKTTNPGSNRLPNNFAPHVRQQAKKPAPPPLPPPTPQSNFLNAVQLQPASVSGPNPPAFSALLSNKNVIIPNAFYGNPPNVRGTADTDLDRRYCRWLENFLNQFCKPQFVATHSCFVFLQRALKYKDFVRIKTLRTNMNSHSQNASNQINGQLMTDLRTIFLKNVKKLTNYGRRFCELTCSSAHGKTVALMAHAISGKVTLKTCNFDTLKTGNAAVTSAPSSSNANATTLTRKRQLEEDEDEYTPDKSKLKTKAMSASENGDEDSGETGDDRKRSLRTKRTKRLDNSFSYNEDDLLAEYEIDDEDDQKLAQIEIQRKIEQKRLEAQKQRQQQAKSFESAFIQAFAKSIDGPTTSTNSTKNSSTQRLRFKNTATATATSIRQYTANNDAEDLLQATWIENLENDDTQVISDDDEPKEHRIYKQQKQKQQQLQQQQEYYTPTSKLPTRHSTNPSPRNSSRTSSRNQQEEIITGDDDYEENNYFSNSPSNIDPLYWPKNVDPQMHVHGKHKDRCVICNLSCQRLVHHYVNEHRGCEVYNSRLSSSQLKLLKQGNCTASNVSLYKNGQFQYEAFCIFCQKQSRFMLPYWYQHFTMHTGEYAYRCSGCGIRKPTRSLLNQHQTQGCPDAGGIIQDYAHDSKSMQIEARICTLCNYVQMHRTNIVKHLHLQHNIKQILPKHIQTIVLMKTQATLSPATSMPSPSSSSSHHNKHLYNAPQSYGRPQASYSQNTYIIDDDDNDVTYEEITPEDPTPTNSENHYYNYIPPYMQAAVNSGNFSFEDVDAGEDLSFMICGMLDVQMNPE
ncbi:uncharacterized protein LOC119601412 isoform X1 [Lucilia sericata]|uniref:uncharacterized protein LOC119601412 isoform X1 n=2 Tax=Lucilia sericata TaxID=13632 RepID=UPI0018A87814|nr:uncharacterized protein LOC119601412 isoform X1 [Lucilia sericata]XP_037808266.1 uncharacterized protein LOC119601412 isoform X1 [Lucilia sericata]